MPRTIPVSPLLARIRETPQASLARMIFGAIVFGLVIPAKAAPIFFGPTPYLSSADIPAGFYAGGSPLALDDLEDGSLDFGITANLGSVLAPSSITDSVDVDDGAIDGSGVAGHSWNHGGGFPGVTFTFAQPVTAAAVVWTDGFPGSTVTFEAFAPGPVSLGTISAPLGDGDFGGGTAEDRFFGVQDFSGIIAINLRQPGGGIEMDHIQFGNAIPEPSTLLLLAIGFAALAVFIRPRPKR